MAFDLSQLERAIESRRAEIEVERNERLALILGGWVPGEGRSVPADDAGILGAIVEAQRVFFNRSFASFREHFSLEDHRSLELCLYLRPRLTALIYRHTEFLRAMGALKLTDYIRCEVKKFIGYTRRLTSVEVAD